MNEFVTGDAPAVETLKVDPVIETEQRERLAVLRARRDGARVSGLRSRLAAAAQTDENLMPLFIEAVENDVTLGEICSTLREAWGEYRPGNWV
jgi:methylmalonyl-CoA mutase N-terminal domain/subunit